MQSIERSEPTAAPRPAPDPVPWSTWGQAAIIVLGAFTSMLSSTIANVALPTIGTDLHASGAAVQWIATGYLLALAAGVPLSGWAARRFGPTQLWLGGLALFCAFSIWCALAGTIQLLIVGRVLQGLAGGLLVPAGQTITGIVAGRQHLGRVMSTIGIAIVVAPTLGTTLGGVVLSDLSWPWLFWISVPLGLVALAAGLHWLPRVRTGESGPLDVLGLALALTGLPLLTYGIAAIGDAGGPGSTLADAYAAAGAALLVAFGLRSARTSTPLLNVRLFTNPVFASGAAIMFFGGAVTFAAQVVLPLYFVDVRHESLLVAGLLVGPQVVGTAIGFPLAGTLADRHGAGLLLVVGGIVTAVGTIPLALVTVDSGYVWIGSALFVRGFGVALATIPAMTAGLAAVTRAQLPDAAPLLNILQRTGASIGTGLVAVLFSSHLGDVTQPASAAGAFRYTNWWLFAGACLIVLPACLLVRAERT